MEIWPELMPDTMSADFEEAFINAVNNVWPNVQVIGCYFHFAQVIKKSYAKELIHLRIFLVTSLRRPASVKPKKFKPS